MSVLGLTAIDSLNEAPHPILPQIARESYRENQDHVQGHKQTHAPQQNSNVIRSPHRLVAGMIL
jgi:hypothetical protein